MKKNTFLSVHSKRLDSKQDISRGIDCTFSLADGFPIEGSDREPEPQYLCTTDEGYVYKINEASNDEVGNVSSQTKLHVPSKAVSRDHIDWNVAQGSRAFAIGASGENRRMLSSDGKYDVLVVIVTDSNGLAPPQGEEQLYKDVFIRGNNLKERYGECSNGSLILNPASGNRVHNGVLTIETTTSMHGADWTTCGNVASMSSSGISRDLTMVVCPEEVNFRGAAAWGDTG